MYWVRFQEKPLKHWLVTVGKRNLSLSSNDVFQQDNFLKCMWCCDQAICYRSCVFKPQSHHAHNYKLF